MNRNLHCAFSVAKSEYIKWISNPRVVIVGVLIIFIRTLTVEPLLERAAKLNESLDILEPFVAIGNSGMLVMLIPCVFLVLISDYPKMTGNTLFLIQRTGRWNWFVGQIIFFVWAIFTFLFAVLVGGICVSDGHFTGVWSDVVTKYDTQFPNEAGNFASQLLPSNLYNQISLISAVIQTISFLSAYLFLLSMINFCFKQMHIQSLGLFTVILVVAAGVVTCSLKSDIMWMFPMANTIIWLHYDVILDEPYVPVWYSSLYFAILISIVVTVNCIAVNRLEFINTEMVE